VADVAVLPDTGAVTAEPINAPAANPVGRTEPATAPIPDVATGFGDNVSPAPFEPPTTVAPSTPVSPTRRAPSKPTPAPTRPTPTVRPTPTTTRTPAALTPPATVEQAAPVTSNTRAPEPARQAEAPSRGGGARRVQDLAERCTSAIAGNDGGTASRLLSGDASGLLAAINEGRIESASGGSVSVDEGDGRAEGSFSVRITWRTSFGGNKSGTARLSAAASLSDGGWAALRCRVENGGGVR
jgi:hypothetical protein